MILSNSIIINKCSNAAIRPSGDMVQFLLRTNLIAWARFGTLAIKELNTWYNAGHIDSDAVDEYLDNEYKKMLMESQ